MMVSTFSAPLFETVLGLQEDAERAYYSSRRALWFLLIFWGFFVSLLFWVEGVFGEGRWEVAVVGAVVSFLVVVVPQIFAVFSEKSRLKKYDAIVQNFKEV